MRALLMIAVFFGYPLVAETKSEINHYLKQFQVAARRYSKIDFKPGSLGLIRFVTGGESIDSRSIAVCTPAVIPVIEITASRWNRADEWGREAIIFHELGHCVLGRLQHDDSTIVRHGKRMARTLMSTNLFDDTDDYLLNREYYQRELFEGAIAIPTIFFQGK